MTNDARGSWEPITEHIADWKDADLQVDVSERIVRNVVLSGAVSRNGHRYTPEALQQAAGLYEHKPVFLDHAPHLGRPFDRSTRDLVGTVLAARYEADRIRGDIQVLDTEAGRTFLALVEAQQPAFGMSHVVLAQRGSDPKIVERIHDVVSVDAVVFPATTTSLRESHESGAEAWSLLQEQLREQLRQTEAEVVHLQAALHQREAAAEVGALLAASRLPPFAITPFFREQLQGTADADQRRQLVAERERLLQLSEQPSVISRSRAVVGDPQNQQFIRAVRGTSVGVLQGPT